MFNKKQIDKIIYSSLEEDSPFGDLTSDSIFSNDSVSEAVIISKDIGIICGINIANRVFEIVDSNIKFESYFSDGDEIKKGDLIAKINGNTKNLLLAERTALNLMQRLSGISTKTNEAVKTVKGLNTRIVDTRKTTPGLRVLEKYAVRVGGGNNHRYCLSDGVLIKDNHIKAAGGVKQAILKVRENIPHTVKIEIETESISDVMEALEAKADIIMLDNMTKDTMIQAIKLIDKRALIEASGNITLENIKEIASIGVDIISMGSLTYSVKALDISMRFN